MAATITRLRVVMKRGRKVIKGPAASVSVLYSTPQEQPLDARQLCLETEAEKFAQMLADRVMRQRKKAQEDDEWLARSPTVACFPKSSRFRSVSQVRNLKAGKSETEDESSDPLADRIAARCKEIVAERESNGGANG